MGPAHVLDQEELDMADSISARGAANSDALPERHEQAALMRSAFNDYVLVELSLDVPLASRLKEPSDRVWDPAFRAYGITREAEPDGTSEAKS